MRGGPRAGRLAFMRSYAELPGLMTQMTGDEKHGPSATSTLDVLWVLYDQVLRVHADRQAEIERELRASWQSGVEETRKILTPEQRTKILQPEDVAAAVLFVCTLPPRANVPELIIKPTAQAYF